jgi:RNA polymerase sigma-70 factor (ECF subfamily)
VTTAADDATAFVDLVRRHDRALRALAWRLLGDRDRMDDVLQEAYVKAFRALPTFRGDADASPGTWLYRITYNACMDELRRQRRVVLLPLDDAIGRPDPAGDVGDRVVRSQRLAAAIDALPPDHRAAVLLVDGEGFDYASAADVLGIPEGTVRSRLSRARARLRAALGEEEGEERHA